MNNSQSNKVEYVSSTYTDGPTYKVKYDITRRDFYNMCQKLSERLDLKVYPEGISEGGIHIMAPIGYKSVRLHRIKDYPYITSEESDDWATDNTVLINTGSKLDTTLKAFYGAPVFTIKELKIIDEEFEKIGLLSNHKMPRIKDLSIQMRVV